MIDTSKSNPKYVKTTMGELNARLPIGTPLDGKLVKAVESVRYRLAEEREIAKLKREGGLNGITYTTKALSILLSKLGNVNMRELKSAERELAIGQSYMADVLYAFLLVRREAVGTDIPMIAECPRCKNPQNKKQPLATQFTADLNTLDVLVANEAKDLHYDITLRDGVTILGKQTKLLHMEPPVWSRLDPSGEGDDALQILSMLRAGLVGADGVDGVPVLLDNDADEIGRYDLAVIERTINDNTPGPIMLAETNCKKCNMVLLQPINWLSESFFSIASLPEPKAS